LDSMLAAPGPVPLPPAQVAVGEPASLLRRRPDIRAAERQIASSNATIGQHVADYFPKLQLLGNLGFSSTDVSQLFDGGSFSTVVAPILQWKPFDFGRTADAVHEAKAERDEAVAQYESTVLKALNDAETALSRYGYQEKAVVNLERVQVSADRAARLTRLRYQGGTTTLTDVLDTERQRVQSEQALAQGRAELTQDFVALEKSLGLGWKLERVAFAG
jgi:outer membrane protein TolC